MAKARQPELSELINTIKKRKAPSLIRADSSALARRAVRRRNIIRNIKPIFANAGVDIDKLNNILSQDQVDAHRSAERVSVRTKKTFSYLQKVFQQSIENKRKALEQLANAIGPAGPRRDDGEAGSLVALAHVRLCAGFRTPAAFSSR